MSLIATCWAQMWTVHFLYGKTIWWWKLPPCFLRNTFFKTHNNITTVEKPTSRLLTTIIGLKWLEALLHYCSLNSWPCDQICHCHEGWVIWNYSRNFSTNSKQLKTMSTKKKAKHFPVGLDGSLNISWNSALPWDLIYAQKLFL